MVKVFDNVLYSYQKKIGSYDAQQWEKTIEERMLKGMNAIPKKVAKLKTELIDLDLIRGTAFTKAKQQQGWLVATYFGINRVIFFPLYLKWWREQTNSVISIVLLILYVLQVISLRFYFANGLSSEQFSDVPASEVLIPLVMMLILGVIHTQIVGNNVKKNHSCIASKNFKNKTSPQIRKKKRKKKTKESLDEKDAETGELEKNGSDEESGLGSLDLKSDLPLNQSISERRGITSEPLNLINKNIPRIEIDGRASGENSDISSDDFDVDDNSINYMNWRRYSDSKKFRSLNKSSDNEMTTRRHSEGSKDAKKRKFRDKLRSKKRNSKFQSLHLYPPKCHHTSNCCSSCESEGTMSPTTPTPVIGIVSDLDWPIINSDGSSDEEDSHQETATTATAEYFIYPELCDDVPPPLFHFINDYSHDGNSGETKVSCAIWQQNECQKVDLSVVDISSAIIRKVDSIKHSSEYLYLGFIFSIIVALLPGLFRIQQNGNSVTAAQTNTSEIIDLLNFPALDIYFLAECVFGSNWRVQFVVVVAMVQRFFLSILYFFLLCVAERTFKERFLYSKYFSQLTRRDRAKKSEVPHFRLHKVRNLKVWLSVRSYLRRHGPLGSVDAICSSSFVIAISILTFICLQLLKESEICAAKLYCWEMVFWNLALGIFIMRLMILSSRINRKYRGNLSVLITEQINLYLQLEQKPHKKEELTLANHVLKLAADLLKELESPYKISGFCANPYLYNITKVVVLSAFSAVLTELLGFKLKLYKIKLR